MGSLTIQDQSTGAMVATARQVSLRGRKAAQDLMSLDRNEARLALASALTHPPSLVVIVENSMDLDGFGGASLLHVLEPEEIGNIVVLSRQLFPTDFLYFNGYGAWMEITPERAREIFTNGSRKEKDRLRNVSSATNSHWWDGPWFTTTEEVGIRYEIVLDYLRSIVDAPQTTKWKKAAAEAIGEDLLALTQWEHGEVIDLCRQIDGDLSGRLKDFMRGTRDFTSPRADVIGRHMDEVAKYSGRSIITDEQKQKLDAPADQSADEIVAGLLDLAEEKGPSPNDFIKQVSREADDEISRALRDGLPGDGEIIDMPPEDPDGNK